MLDSHFGTFHKMEKISSWFEVEVRGILEQATAKYPDIKAGLFVFWSPKRKEMLPESDVDMVVIVQPQYRDFITNALDGLNFDKLDINERSKLQELSDCVGVWSIESDFCDVRFVAWDQSISDEYDSLKIKERYLDKEMLATKLIYQIPFFDYSYGEKKTNVWVNLKYSNWWYRDLVYFNRLHQFYQWEHNNKSPNILQSIELLFWKKEADELRKCIDFIGYVKYRILQINKSTSQKWKGFMNAESAKWLIKNDSKKLNKFWIQNERELINRFNECRSTINFFKRKVYSDVVQNIGKNHDPMIPLIISLETVPEYILSRYQDYSTMTKVAIIRKLINSSNIEWLKRIELLSSNETSRHILASLLCNQNCSLSFMNHIADNQSNINWYEYLNRLIIKNKSVDTDLLIKMRWKRKLVWADSKNDEYVNLINKLLLQKWATI